MVRYCHADGINSIEVLYIFLGFFFLVMLIGSSYILKRSKSTVAIPVTCHQSFNGARNAFLFSVR